MKVACGDRHHRWATYTYRRIQRESIYRRGPYTLGLQEFCIRQAVAQARSH